jgi:hypothetical protein
MRANLRKTAELGEVVVTAFDKAASYSTDPREVAQLATQAIALMLRSRRRRVTSPRGSLEFVDAGGHVLWTAPTAAATRKSVGRSAPMR